MSTEEKLLKYGGGGLCCFGLLLAVILIPVSIKNVGYDEYAIRYDDLTNQVHESVYTEGKYLFTPQTTMFRFPNTIQKLSVTMNCLSSNGVLMYVEVDIQFQFPKAQIFTIFDEFGPKNNLLSYFQLAAADSIRDSCGKFSAKNFYEQRTVIQNTLEMDLAVAARTSNSHLNVTQVVLSNYEFPTALDSAIKEKRAAENDIEVAGNQRAGALTEAETTLLVAEKYAEELNINAQSEVASIQAEASAKSAAIEAVWIKRQSVYEQIKTAMNMTATEFVYQYLTSVVLQIAETPITSLD